MFEFKVKRCPRARPHDWTACPFAHPGEKAKRRDPRRFKYSGTACPDYRKNGSCARGDACPLAHGVFESWLHPSRYKTQLCTDGQACQRRVCFFAHTESELRKPEEDPTIAVAGLHGDLTSEAAQQVLQQQQLAHTLATLLGQPLSSTLPLGMANPLDLFKGAALSSHAASLLADPSKLQLPSGGVHDRAQLLQAQLMHLQQLQQLQRQQQQQFIRNAHQPKDAGPADGGPVDAAGALQKQIVQLCNALAQQSNSQQLGGGAGDMLGLLGGSVDQGTLLLLQQQLAGAAGGGGGVAPDSLATTPRSSHPLTPSLGSGHYDAEAIMGLGRTTSLPVSSMPPLMGNHNHLFSAPDVAAHLHKPLDRRLSLDSGRAGLGGGGIPAWHGDGHPDPDHLAAHAAHAASTAAGGSKPAVDAALVALLKDMSLGGGMPNGGAPNGAANGLANGVGFALPPNYSLTTRKSVDNGVLARMSELAQQLTEAELSELEARLTSGALGTRAGVSSSLSQGASGGGSGELYAGDLPADAQSLPSGVNSVAGASPADGQLVSAAAGVLEPDGESPKEVGGAELAAQIQQAQAAGKVEMNGVLDNLINLLGKNGAPAPQQLKGMVRNHSIDRLLAELPRSMSEVALESLAAGGPRTSAAVAAAAAAANSSAEGGVLAAKSEA